MLYQKSYRLIFISLVAVLVSCKTTISTVKPAEVFENRTSFDRRESLINVPIKATTVDLAAQINSYFKGELYRDDSFTNNGGDNLKCYVSSYDDIKLKTNNNGLQFYLPLSIKGTYRRLGMSVSFSGILKARYITKISLGDNYQLTSKTKSNGYDWVMKPQLKFGSVNVSVGWIMDLVLDSQEDYINTTIDRAVKDNIDLKEMIRPGIEALSRPINVSDAYRTWFKITPVELFATQISAIDDTLKFTVGLKAFTETFMGEEPEVEFTLDSLPFHVVEEVQDDFNIGIVSVLTHNEVSEILNKEYVESNYEYKQGKNSIQFTKMNVYSHQEELVIEVGMKGSIVGDVYLRGTPVYDSLTKSIVMNDLDFDLDSEQKLLRTANWLVHGSLKRIMKKYMVFPIGVELEALKKESEVYLQEYEPVKGVVINGSLQDVKTSDLYVIEDAIVIVVGIKGNMNVQIKGVE
jgi:hypothetical protein